MVYDLIWDSPLTRALSAAALDSMPDAGRGDLIDLGCGTGLMSRGTARYTIGVDSNAAMLRRAEQTGRIDRAVMASADATGLPSASASAVIVGNLLHLHPRPGAVIAEALRLCRPTGRVFLCWPLDRPNTDSLLRLDLRMGRPLLAAVVAHLLRQLIGRLAVLTRTDRNSSASIERDVRIARDSELVLDTTLLGCQRMVTLAAGPSARRHSAPNTARTNPVGASHRENGAGDA